MEVIKLHDQFAVEVTGIDFRREQTLEVKRELMQLLAEHKILLFRNQWLDTQQLTRFGEIFGRLWGLKEGLENNREAMVDNNEHVYMVSDKGMLSTYELNWHCDLSWWGCEGQPARVLYGVNIDAERIHTPVAFIDLQATYDSLQPEQQCEFRGCVATYRNMQHGKDDLYLRRSGDSAMSRPLVRRHPYTGRLGMNDLGVFLTALGEVSGPGIVLTGDLLRDAMTDLIEKQKEKNLWQHVYRNGDLLIHDNLSTMHARPRITGAAADRPSRELKRLTLDVLWHRYHS
jgi:alpha-ketoglutarate-dependent taurine dioxygenase